MGALAYAWAMDLVMWAVGEIDQSSGAIPTQVESINHQENRQTYLPGGISSAITGRII